MSSVDVSVVIPMHNAKRWIGQMLESLQRQTLRPRKVIVVDDGSTDRSAEVVKRFTERDPSIEFLCRENSGPATVRNAGFERVDSRYVMFLDADDLLPPFAIQRLYDAAEEDDAQIVCGMFEAFDGKRVWRHESMQAFEGQRWRGVDLHTHPQLLSNMSPWNKLFVTDFIRGHGLRFPEGIFLREDIYFVTAAMFHASRISVVPEIVYRYRSSGTGALTRRVDDKTIRDILAVSGMLDAVQEKCGYGEDAALFQLRYSHEYRALLYRLRPLVRRRKRVPEREKLCSFTNRLTHNTIARFAIDDRAVAVALGKGEFELAETLLSHSDMIEASQKPGARIKRYLKNAVWSLYRLLTLPLYRFASGKRTGIWLVGERHGQGADDTGWLFFNYCEKKHPDKKVYFVTAREDAPESHRRIVRFGTFRHHLLVWLADAYLFSDSYRDIFPAWPRMLHRKPKVACFLQHGVFGLKKSEAYKYANVRKRNEHYDLIVVSSEKEKRLVQEGLGFEKEVPVVTGLSRFDRLYARGKSGPEKKILVVPTWRYELRYAQQEQYLASGFHRHWHSLLSSRELHDLLESGEYEILFALHHAASRFSMYYLGIHERIRIVDMNRESFGALVPKSSMLVTDYSSVAFNMAYLERPVLFYQFDTAEFLLVEGGAFLDYEKELFGPVAETEAEVIGWLKYNVANGFKVRPEDARRSADFFRYRDIGNCRRIFEAVEQQIRRKTTDG